MPEDGTPTSSPYPYREPSPVDGATQYAEQAPYGYGTPDPTTPLYPYRNPSPTGDAGQGFGQAPGYGTMALPPTATSPMPVGSPATYGNSPYAQYGQQPPYGVYSQTQGQPKSRRGLVIGIVGAVALVAVVALLAIKMNPRTGTPTPSPSSPTTTTATLPANPRGNEPADIWAQVMNPNITEEELDVLLRLEGSVRKAVDDLPKQRFTYQSVYSYIDVASSGKWPGEEEGWGTPETCPQNPQLWVRLAMMSRSWACEELGGEWEIIDFSYPIGNEGGDGHTVTRLIGISEDVLGMAVDVEYHRWETSPRFAFAEGTREAAEENHRRLGQARGNLSAYAKELGHETILQGGERPAVIMNARGTGDNDDYYDIQRQEKLTEIAEHVAQIMRDAGYETGDMLVIPWADDAGTIRMWSQAPASRLQWAYALSDGDYDPYYGIDRDISLDEARIRLASGLYDITGYVSASDAHASWNARGDVRVLAADLSGSVYGEGTTPDAERIFEKAEVSVDQLPQQIGTGNNILYGFLSWPGTPKPNSALWVFYAYDGKDPSVETIKADDQSAILFKQLGKEVIDVPKRIPPKDADTHVDRLADGTEVTLYAHSSTWRPDEKALDEAESWVKAASWSRQLDDGETYSYLVLLYEDVPDEEIAKVAEQVR